MPDAAYYREWRKAHPEYRQREAERRKKRRELNGRGDRRAEYRKRKSRAIAPLPALHLGHELFDQAKQMAKITNGLKHLTHPYYDDLISEIVLGLLEGRPEAAQRSFLARERNWLHKTISPSGVEGKEAA